MARYVLITGKIGAGKSFVSELLRKKRYRVLDSDFYAKYLYEKDKEVFRHVVGKLGPACLKQDGTLDLEYLKSYLLTHDPEDPENFVWKVATRLASWFSGSTGGEIVFVEAAPTRQIGELIDFLHIEEAIVVSSDEAWRRQRLAETRGMSEGDIDAFDNIQNIDNIQQIFDPANKTRYRATNIKTYYLNNCDDPAVVNARLMDIIEKEIRPTVEEKFALYSRYLERSPDYCKMNAMCYSFYNMGGCNECPFPCSQKDPDFKEANRRYREEFEARKSDK